MVPLPLLRIVPFEFSLLYCAHRFFTLLATSWSKLSRNEINTHTMNTTWSWKARPHSLTFIDSRLHTHVCCAKYLQSMSKLDTISEIAAFHLFRSWYSCNFVLNKIGFYCQNTARASIFSLVHTLSFTILI